MGFRDPFQYRTRSEIDKGWPDLHTGNKEWNLKKIYKVKTSCLKLMLNIKELFDVRMDTVWLSQLYFQRYFSQNSFQTNTAVVFVTACVHLACKANDQPRPLDTVIKRTYRLRYSRDPTESKKIDDIMVFVEYKVQLSAVDSWQAAHVTCTTSPASPWQNPLLLCSLAGSRTLCFKKKNSFTNMFINGFATTYQCLLLLQERVLLAERALLYAFAFDFRNGDPPSFALKYNRLHSADNLVDPDAAETFFAWLTFAGQATTLCLQYPPSLLAVASLWYAQHLSRGQVSVTYPPDSLVCKTLFCLVCVLAVAA